MKSRISSFLLAFFVLLPSAGAKKMDKELAEQVYSVLERANRSGDRVTRALATEAFGSLRAKDTKPYAVDALKDPVFEVRAAAMRALIRLKDKSWIKVLVDDMKNPKVNMAEVMNILGMLKDKEAVKIALSVMNDPKAPTKNQLIEAFGALGGKRAQLFFKPLITGKDTALAEGVQGYVLTLRTPEALSLIDLVMKVGTPQMQQRALEALAEMPKGTNIKVARKLLKSKDAAMAMRAAEVLAAHGDSAGKGLLLPLALSKNEKEAVRALDALVSIASKDLYGPLAGYLRKRDTSPDILKRVLEIHHRTKSAKLADVARKLRRNDNIRTQALDQEKLRAKNDKYGSHDRQ